MPLSLASLNAMKRPELQGLCKEIGAKANGKTEQLLAALVQHYQLNADVSERPVPAPAKAVTVKGKKASSTPSEQRATIPPAATASAPAVRGQEEEDEMRLEASAVVQPATVKKATTKAPKARITSDSTGVTAPATPAVQQTVYATSPATKESIATLLSTVKDLQAELNTTRSALGKLESTVAAIPAPLPPRSPALKKAEVLSIVDTKISEFRAEMVDSLDQRVTSVAEQVAELKAALPAALDVAESESIKMLVSRFESQLLSTNSWKAGLEQAIDSLRTDVSSRVAALEALPVQAAALSPSASISTNASPVVKTPTAAPASPTFSDAPPTQTLGSFCSPPSSHIGTPAPASRVASPAPTSRRSPRKIPSSSNLPVLALPSHMVAHVSPARSPRRASPAPAQPQSPARPTATLGKHARCSDASDLSVAVEAVRSPPAAEMGSLASVMASASKEGGHIRKRMRVSNGSVVEEQEDDERADSTFQSAESSFDEGVSASFAISGSRDFVVETKTGEEAPAARPAVSDPSFFSFGAVPNSPAPIAAAARKSLPMAALPFPLVSPFTASRSSKSAHGTPMRPNSARKFFGDASNSQRMPVPPTPPASKTLYGSERQVFGDGGEEEDLEASGRFEDVGEASPRKPLWGSGIFGGV